MASNIEEDIMNKHKTSNTTAPQATPRVYTIVYPMVLVLAYWHVGAVYGLYLSVTSARGVTMLFNFLMYVAAGWGVTAGTHRLWSHRAYKATLPLQTLLMLFHTFAAQSTVINWARDHRLHHKYCDTDADPYNSKRGFFYSHMGWLIVRKHPDLLKKGKTLDLSDLLENPVLQFQKKLHHKYCDTDADPYNSKRGFFSSHMGWLVVRKHPDLLKKGKTLDLSDLLENPVLQFQRKYYNVFVSLLVVIGSHVSFSINSIAHMFGNKPYDKSITPTTNVTLSVVGFGEGHNYHHVFPFDYRTSELGNSFLNLSTKFIDFCAFLGWAYDMKEASGDIIVKRALKTGDGSNLWGQVPKLKQEE